MTAKLGTRLTRALVGASLLCGVTGHNAESAEPLISKIPPEFQGRWLDSPDQCKYGHKNWMYISNLKVQSGEGEGSVVSVRRMSAVEIEVDVTWRSLSTATSKSDDWRHLLRFVLSRNGRALSERTVGADIVRVRCD